MFRIRACPLVLGFYGIWLVFGKTQHDVPRHNAYPFLLVHNRDSETCGLRRRGTMLSELSSMPGILRLVM